MEVVVDSLLVEAEGHQLLVVVILSQLRYFLLLVVEEVDLSQEEVEGHLIRVEVVILNQLLCCRLMESVAAANQSKGARRHH